MQTIDLQQICSTIKAKGFTRIATETTGDLITAVIVYMSNLDLDKRVGEFKEMFPGTCVYKNNRDGFVTIREPFKFKS